MRNRLRILLWRLGLLELPWWDRPYDQAAPEQPAVPMVQGEPLRAALAAIRFGRASA